ncbi:lipopolysaccharide assembly protein LapB [Vitiosangium sp. GDMCC 1.1324]|uniref:tetratricopeptide repeat protein n=1 Tax=Vitiosangium sp. (strain GDMCC 1.1324) TaxID=2138576 RepID=UPI000D3B485A|nr:hypothetical protein [Vitiosangium sp. GDMCC 1.1324]PTL85666.1 hypothetical protein DAT35_02835 [Vitiosangium sp. GDMCC 1.1324]
MERLNALAENLKHVAGLLAEDVLEPDPARTDWNGMKVRVDMAREGMDKVLEGLAGALEEADEAELKTLVRKRVADMAARTAALLHAAGSTEGARRMLEKAFRITEDAAQRAELEAGLGEPELFCLYQHAVWLLGHGRFEAADVVLKRVGKEARQKTLKDAAQKALRGSRPLTGAPALFRINGCGVGLYGKRDEAPDGTYVATYFISLLFIPVFPLTAYRVREVDGNAYQFFAKESLGPVTRAWQRLVLAGIAGAVLWSGVNGYLHSPERLARLALEEAQAAEATLSREDALERYRSVIDAHFNDSVRTSAADAVVRLSLAGLPTPCTRDTVDAVGRVVTGIDSLPAGSYKEAPATRLGDRLDGCAREIGQETMEDARAALAVVESALRVATQHPALKERQVELKRSLADRLVKEQPLQALALYVELPAKEALDAAQALIDTFGEAPSLWLEASSSVEKWMGHKAQDKSRKDKVALYRSRLAAARTAHANDEALITEGDEAKLVKALKASPGNQELAVAVASLARGRGDAKGALATLTALGPVGRLTGETRMMLGICHRDLGQLAEADAVLSSFVAERLAPFQRVQRQYEEEAQAVQERLVSRARAGQLPKAVETRIEQASGQEEEQRKIFREWMSEQMESDPRLEKLRGEYLRHESVVPATLMLGMVKLQRANDAEGEARRTLLGEAERVFLSIRQEAEGNPRFHLGLGQVYHRLGRAKEGDKELRGVVERKDPELTLEVAHVYRDLDRIDQATPLCEEVYATATDEASKHTAASLLSRMATDPDEEEKWLRKSDLSSPSIQNELLELEAHRALREGRLEDADRALAKSVAYRSREAKHNAVAANNTATTLMSRFQVTADMAHLRSAVRYLEDAVRLAPDNALVVGNLADAQEFLGTVTVLERWIRTKPLHLSNRDAEELLGVLSKGPLREEVLRAMDAEPSLRRSQELSQQEQTLAPGKASAWERQLQWLRRHRDERGLAALAKRLETLPPFEGGGKAVARRKWESGEMDAQLGKWAVQNVALAEAALKRAKQTNHAPTIAAAWHLLGETLVSKDYFEQKPEQLDTMLDAYRQAGKLWPQLGASGDLEQVLAIAAVERAMAKSEALAKVWKEERRTQSTTALVHHALTGPAGAEVAAVLRTQPELKEAAEHARERIKGAPEMDDWVLAKAAGDVVLEQAAAAVFSRPEVELGLAIDMRLAGGHPREKADQELFQSGKAQKGHP